MHYSSLADTVQRGENPSASVIPKRMRLVPVPRGPRRAQALRPNVPAPRLGWGEVSP